MARQKSNIHYLYKTTCLITGRYYIGMHSTSNLEDGYMGSGKRLRYSIRKYGKENHKKEILEFFDTRELLIEAEEKAITSDMISGGTSGWTIENAKKGRVECNKNLKKRFGNTNDWIKKFNSYVSKKAWLNKEYRDKKIKNLDWTGKKHSEETKQKMSESSKGIGVGKTNSQYGTCWITKDGVNKKIKKEDLEFHLNDGWIKGRK